MHQGRHTNPAFTYGRMSYRIESVSKSVQSIWLWWWIIKEACRGNTGKHYDRQRMGKGCFNIWLQNSGKLTFSLMNCQMILVIYIIPKVDLGQSNVRCKKSMVGWWSASESVSWSPFSPGFFMNYTEGHRTQIIIKTSPRRTCVHGYSSILFFFFFSCSWFWHIFFLGVDIPHLHPAQRLGSWPWSSGLRSPYCESVWDSKKYDINCFED